MIFPGPKTTSVIIPVLYPCYANLDTVHASLQVPLLNQNHKEEEIFLYVTRMRMTDITSFYFKIILYTFNVFSFLLLLRRSSSFFPRLVFLHHIMFASYSPSTLSNLTFSFAHFSYLEGKNWAYEVTVLYVCLFVYPISTLEIINHFS